MEMKPNIGSVLLCTISFLFATAQLTRKVPSEQIPCAASTTDDHAPSNVHYVSVEGKDSSIGSLSHPWATIQHADSVAKPGDTVIVLDGIYRGDISLASSGSPGEPILYKAQNKWRAKLIGTGSGAGSAVVGMSGGYIIFQGFDITGSNANGIILASYGSIANHNQALKNYVHDLVVPCNSDSGTAIETGGGDNYSGISHNDMLENLIVNITPNGGCVGGHPASGLFAETPNSVIANNIVINAGYAIQGWHAASNLLIYGNTLVNNIRSITVGAGDAPYERTNNYTTVQGNVIYNSTEFAIAETGRTGLHNRYLDNLIYAGNTRVSLNNGLSATHSIIADPQFINNTGTASGNYQFKATSPVHRGRLARLWTPAALAAAITSSLSKGVSNVEEVVPVAGIRASTTRVFQGESSVLTWTTKNAVRATLNDMPVPLNGSLTVQPGESKIYKVIATGPSGNVDWGSVSIAVVR
ncbi:MAG: hypothetical protein JWQ42_4236 [Edaphobacter sp.]|nr:hypothetical protein [Edaphobacter sp.]